MTVKQMVEGFLTVNGYDGLYTTDCGCFVEDLMPCTGYGCIPGTCEAGVKKTWAEDGVACIGIGPRLDGKEAKEK